MPLYKVRVWTTVYVEAETESEAQEVTDKELRHILSSETEWECEPEYEVTTLRDVRHGWDGDCFPYSAASAPFRTIQQVLEQ